MGTTATPLAFVVANAECATKPTSTDAARPFDIGQRVPQALETLFRACLASAPSAKDEKTDSPVQSDNPCTRNRVRDHQSRTTTSSRRMRDVAGGVEGGRSRQRLAHT